MRRGLLGLGPIKLVKCRPHDWAAPQQLLDRVSDDWAPAQELVNEINETLNAKQWDNLPGLGTANKLPGLKKGHYEQRNIHITVGVDADGRNRVTDIREEVN
jgi:hypothetical protein